MLVAKAEAHMGVEAAVVAGNDGDVALFEQRRGRKLTASVMGNWPAVLPK